MLTKDEFEFLNYAVRNGFSFISKEGNSNFVRIFCEDVEKDEHDNPVIEKDGSFRIKTREQFCQTSNFKQLVKFKIYKITELLESNESGSYEKN